VDWFEALFGFREVGYDQTRERLVLEGERLVSRVNGRSWSVGSLSIPSLGELRAQVQAVSSTVEDSPTRVRLVQGDVAALHGVPANRGALFQVASQFNLLEMVGPYVSPLDGVTRYAQDFTQGPACALSAAAATVYRNYWVEVQGQPGQDDQRQINTLSDLAAALPGGSGVQMRNGYALVDTQSLQTLSSAIECADEPQRRAWMDLLRVGWHQDVECTSAAALPGHQVNQVFCSALPIRYNECQDWRLWEPFARLILDAAYEATLYAGVLQKARGGSPSVYLTLLGGGAFGNNPTWIVDAIRRALSKVHACGLDVAIVSYGPPSDEVAGLV